MAIAGSVGLVGSGAPSHSAPLGTLYWDSTNSKLYVNSDGATTWTEVAGGGGGGKVDFVWSFSGTLDTGQNQLIPKLTSGQNQTLNKLEVLLQVAPTVTSAVFTFKKNGSSIGTVTVSAGGTSGSTTLSPTVSVTAGDVLTVEITQIGAAVPGATATMIARVA